MKRRLVARLLIAATIAGLVAACGGPVVPENKCPQGPTRVCECPDGPGTQSCDETAGGYGPCNCGADVTEDVDADADVVTDSDAATDADAVTDADVDADADAATDADAVTDADAATDADAVTDSDAATDADAVTDADIDADADAATDADATCGPCEVWESCDAGACAPILGVFGDGDAVTGTNWNQSVWQAGP